MTIKKQNFVRGVILRPDDVALEGISGELKVALTAQKLQVYLNTAIREVITADQAQTLTNKTIDADLNTITNIENADIKAGAAIDATKIANGTVSNAEFQTLDGVTSSIQTQIDAKASTASLTAHTGASTGVHGVTGAVLGTSDTQVVTNKTIDADLNTITNIENADIKIGAAIDAAKIANGTVSNAEFQTLDGVTSSIQTQIDSKQATITGAATTIASSNLTVSRALNSDGSGKVAVSTVTSTELGYVSGVTSAIQTQIDAKASTSSLTAHTGASAGVHGVTGAVVGTTDSQTITNKTITGASLQTPTRSDVKQDTFANLTTYASTASNGQLCFATDTKLMYQVVDSALVSVGSGAGGADIFVTLDASEVIGAWTTGNNATFLGAGTIAGTFAKNTSTPLNGNSSYQLTQTSGSLNDYVASAVQSVPIRFRGTTVSVIFPYIYDGNNSDISLVVWDVTNSTKLTDDTLNLVPASSKAIYKANITIPLTCTQIRVGFQVKISNNSKILQFDDIQISADTTRYSDPSTITNWQSYTPTLTGFGTPSSVEFEWRQVGTDIEVRGKFTSGTPTATEARVSLPNSYSSAGTSIIPTLRLSDIAANNTNGAQAIYSLIEPNVTYFTLGVQFASGSALTKANGNALITVGAVMQVRARIPIAGLSASNPQIIAASESFSTDTASLTYAGSGAYTLSTLQNAPVGTFITFTYAINTNTRTQTTTAPTQTTADMNVNGIQLFPRAYNAASTAASPACVAIQIGKGLKGISPNVYGTSGKTLPVSTDYSTTTTTSEVGALVKGYNETTGIYLFDLGACNSSGTTSHFIGIATDLTTPSNGYLVINASKSPALAGVPLLQPRIATISDVKASGTAGGTATSGAYQTRTLNTLDDPTGIVSSLASNQFTLAAGEYYVEASAPAYFVDVHQTKIRNITDSADSIIGTTEFANFGTQFPQTRSFVVGKVIITSTKTFELQHRPQTTRATNGFGIDNPFGNNNVFSIVKIIKVK